MKKMPWMVVVVFLSGTAFAAKRYVKKVNLDDLDRAFTEAGCPDMSMSVRGEDDLIIYSTCPGQDAIIERQIYEDPVVRERATENRRKVLYAKFRNRSASIDEVQEFLELTYHH